MKPNRSTSVIKTHSPTSIVIVGLAVITMMMIRMMMIDKDTQRVISRWKVLHISKSRNYTAYENDPSNPYSSSSFLSSCKKITPSVDSSAIYFTWTLDLKPTSLRLFWRSGRSLTINACKDAVFGSHNSSSSSQMRSLRRSSPTFSSASSRQG